MKKLMSITVCAILVIAMLVSLTACTIDNGTYYSMSLSGKVDESRSIKITFNTATYSHKINETTTVKKFRVVKEKDENGKETLVLISKDDEKDKAIVSIGDDGRLNVIGLSVMLGQYQKK